MVVNSSPVDPASLDLGYLALFLGMQVNRLVVEKMSAAGFQNVRESHGYLIQHLIEKERSITELAMRMEVTQQAASKVVSELAGLGILDVSGASDRRRKIVRLSDRGWEIVSMGRKARREIEKRLMRSLGAAKYQGVREILVAGIEALGGFERIQSRRILAPR